MPITLSHKDEDYHEPESSDINDTFAPQIEKSTHPEMFTGLPLPEQIYSQAASTCASCGGTERLSLLQPCQHQICASCVTGSLNVVGEKDMICMYCFSPIQSFKISRTLGRIHSETPQHPHALPHLRQLFPPQDVFTASSVHSNQFPITPNREIFLAESPRIPLAPGATSTVLRIDNVPWVSKRILLELLNIYLHYFLDV